MRQYARSWLLIYQAKFVTFGIGHHPPVEAVLPEIASFSLADSRPFAFFVEVPDIEMDELAATNTEPAERFDQTPIPKIVHFNVTEHPIAQWTAQQIVEAVPWERLLPICSFNHAVHIDFRLFC
jgi:hypothetical protein